MTVKDFVEQATAAYCSELEALLADHGATVDTDPQLAGVRGAVASAAEQVSADAIGPFLDTAGVMAMLGGVTKQAVSERVRGRRLLALRMGPDGRSYRFPLWQFDGATLAVLPGVLEAVGYRPEVVWHGGLVAAWLCADDEQLGGLRPRDLLAAGQDEEVLESTGDVRAELGSEAGTALRRLRCPTIIRATGRKKGRRSSGTLATFIQQMSALL